MLNLSKEEPLKVLPKFRFGSGSYYELSCGFEIKVFTLDVNIQRIQVNTEYDSTNNATLLTTPYFQRLLSPSTNDNGLDHDNTP